MALGCCCGIERRLGRGAATSLLSGGAEDREREMGGFHAEGESWLPLLEVDVGVALAGFWSWRQTREGKAADLVSEEEKMSGQVLRFLVSKGEGSTDRLKEMGRRWGSRGLSYALWFVAGRRKMDQFASRGWRLW